MLLSIVLVLVLVAFVLRHALRVGRIVQRVLAIAVPAARCVDISSPLLLVWFFADLLFRTAPFAHETVPWYRAHGSDVRVFFHRFLLYPRSAPMLVLGYVIVTVIVALFAALDAPALWRRQRSLKSVLPTTADTSSRQSRLNTSVPAWLVLGVGRLLTSPAFLPAAYFLLSSFSCGFSARGSKFVTGTCTSTLECYTFWHFLLMILSTITLVWMFWITARATVPMRHLVGFGLPMFLRVTIPLRLTLAWSAHILHVFSPCFSILLSLLVNVALLAVGALFLASGAVRLSWWLSLPFVLYQLWCIGIGIVAVVLYFAYSDGIACHACGAGVVTFFVLLLALIGAVLLVWIRRRPQVSDDDDDDDAGTAAATAAATAASITTTTKTTTTTAVVTRQRDEVEEKDADECGIVYGSGTSSEHSEHMVVVSGGRGTAVDSARLHASPVLHASPTPGVGGNDRDLVTAITVSSTTVPEIERYAVWRSSRPAHASAFVVSPRAEAAGETMVQAVSMLDLLDDINEGDRVAARSSQHSSQLLGAFKSSAGATATATTASVRKTTVATTRTVSAMSPRADVVVGNEDDAVSSMFKAAMLDATTLEVTDLDECGRADKGDEVRTVEGTASTSRATSAASAALSTASDSNESEDSMDLSGAIRDAEHAVRESRDHIRIADARVKLAEMSFVSRLG